MSLFGRDHDRDNKRDDQKPESTDAETEASEAVVDGMLSASGGDPSRLAEMIAQHRMQKDRRVWHFLQRRLGNRKTEEVLKEVEAPTTESKAATTEAAVTAPPNYKAFCTSFSTAFAGVMSEFLGAMTEAMVPQYFTASQVAALTAFMATNVVPPNLFHQASGPKLTAQHRILLAGVILAHGTLPPELQGTANLKRDQAGEEAKDRERDDRLHASMCGHWAQQVLLYAGAGIAAQNQQANQTVDSGDVLHLGNAKTEKTFGSQSDKKGLQLQGNQKAAKEAQDRDEAAGRAEAAAAGVKYEVPKKHQDFTRKGEMGAEAFEALRPGDWIYIYNANTSASGQHSEIFIGWDDDSVHTDKGSGVKYKTANVMSQLQVEDGGKVHKQKLGAAWAPGIATVTAINRVSASSSELLDVRSLVAPDAVAKNTKIISDNGLDATRLHDDLLKVAGKELAALAAKKLDPTQQAMFQKAIAEASTDDSPEALALLVACVQRLDLSTGGVFSGRPANGVIDSVILGKGSKKKKKSS